MTVCQFELSNKAVYLTSQFVSIMCEKPSIIFYQISFSLIDKTQLQKMIASVR